MRKIYTIVAALIVFLAAVISSMYFLFPIKHEEIIIKYAKEYDIDPYLVFSIINVESKFKNEANSSKDARGLMQIREITGKWASEHIELSQLTEEDYYNPDVNIKIGVWYISRLKKIYGDNLDKLLAAYNAGIGNVDKWTGEGHVIEEGDIPFKETREYVSKVKLNMKFYKLLY